jgi:hypothetical protein
MNAAEQTPSPEQLQVQALSKTAKAALDFRNPTPVSSPDGGSTRSFTGGNGVAICELGEVTSADGAKTYIFRWPVVVTTPKGPSNNPLGLQASWSTGDSEVNQHIVAGEVTEFDKVAPEQIAELIDFHLGEPPKSPEASMSKNLRKKIGSLLAR